jgi:hypothetical protein
MARNSSPSPSDNTAGQTGSDKTPAPDTTAVAAVTEDEDTILFTVLQPVRVDGVKFMPGEPAPVPYDLVQDLDARGIIDMREQG